MAIAAPTEWKATIVVKGEQGTETRTFRFRKTHHGPVVAIRDGKALTVRMSKFEEAGGLEQRYLMGKARNLNEFRAVMSRLAVPMFNTMYADREGNIWYLYNGAGTKAESQVRLVKTRRRIRSRDGMEWLS
jgi:acyl-homoserine lactone acylase PvdQ